MILQKIMFAGILATFLYGNAFSADVVEYEDTLIMAEWSMALTRTKATKKKLNLEEMNDLFDDEFEAVSDPREPLETHIEATKTLIFLLEYSTAKNLDDLAKYTSLICSIMSFICVKTDKNLHLYRNNHLRDYLTIKLTEETISKLNTLLENAFFQIRKTKYLNYYNLQKRLEKLDTTVVPLSKKINLFLQKPELIIAIPSAFMLSPRTGQNAKSFIRRDTNGDATCMIRQRPKEKEPVPVAAHKAAKDRRK